MMRLRNYLAILVLSSVSIAPAHAQKLVDFPNDGRIKILEYHTNDIYTINTLYGYQTNIEFDEEEQIQTISVGDRSLWQIVPAGRRLFIRPMDEDVSTNMTVITNVRSYQFDLQSGKGKMKDNPDLMYVARFIYPKMVLYTPPPPPPPMPASIETPAPIPEPMPIVPPPPPPPVPVAVPVAQPAPPPVNTAAPIVHPESRYNYLYSYSGKDNLAPTDTYDDGAATYIRFADPKRLPEVYEVRKDGTRAKVDYLVRDGVVVLQQVRERYALVYGEGKANEVYLYNEAKTPATIQP